MSLQPENRNKKCLTPFSKKCLTPFSLFFLGNAVMLEIRPLLKNPENAALVKAAIDQAARSALRSLPHKTSQKKPPNDAE
jgi:hypothetical protein